MKVMTSRKTKEEILNELNEKNKGIIAEKLVVRELSDISEIVLATKSIKIYKVPFEIRLEIQERLLS